MIKQMSIQWQFEIDGKYKNFDDFKCMTCNFFYLQHKENPKKYLLKTPTYELDFRNMTDTEITPPSDSQNTNQKRVVRKIRRLDDTHVKVRPKDSVRIQTAMEDKRRKNKKNFDIASYEWLATNY